jgi:uncharacterized RDD family membrane protein YckC
MQAATPGPAPSPPTGPTTPPLSGIDALMKDSTAQSYWLNRLLALVVDGLIVFIPLVIITVIVAVFVAISGFTPFGIIVGGFVSIVWYFLFILYNMVMESTYGASFGKRFFHLKVVSKSGSNPNLGEAFIRNLSKIYWLILLLDVIVGLAVTKGYQQKYSDKFMGTSVVPV